MATTTTAPFSTYVVKAGDSLGLIAQRLNVALSAILALNHLPDPNKLTAGQVLTVPPTTTTTTVSTTTTLPPTTSPRATNASGTLTVSPARGRAGTTFTLKLTGAQATETISFEIDSPNGKKFTGPPHAAGPDGSVSASYFTQQVDPVGTYTVHATGNQGTSTTTTFGVDPPSSPP
jgi:spore germination protein YaaH